MNYKLVLQSEALFDMQEVFEWYEAQKAGLGQELIEELESSFEKIVNPPLHYSSINERYRKLKVKRFPYIIIYEAEGLNTELLNRHKFIRFSSGNDSVNKIWEQRAINYF